MWLDNRDAVVNLVCGQLCEVPYKLLDIDGRCKNVAMMCIKSKGKGGKWCGNASKSVL